MWNRWKLLAAEQNISDKSKIYIGCMTGTSADKYADFTAAMFDAKGMPLAYRNLGVEVPSEMQAELYYLSTTEASKISIQERHEAEMAFTQFIVEAYKQVIHEFELNKINKSQIVLSPHGQTIVHSPNTKYTYTDQLLHPEYLVQHLGYIVVARHRQAPIVVSTAAPLAPVLIRKIFSHDSKNRILLNGGGIANICVLPCKKPTEVYACDTGPANGPIDALIQYIIEYDQSSIPSDLYPGICSQKMDVSGVWASRGVVIPELLNKFLSHEYFARPITYKSADRAEFNINWVLSACNKKTYAWEDILATLVETVCQSIIDCSLGLLPMDSPETEIISYGGMFHNTYLMKRLETLFSAKGAFSFSKMRDHGYEPDFFESLLLAYLGFCVHQKHPIDLSYCTRSKESQVKTLAIPGCAFYPMQTEVT